MYHLVEKRTRFLEENNKISRISLQNKSISVKSVRGNRFQGSDLPLGANEEQATMLPDQAHVVVLTNH